jgi:hypothetical protein
MKPIAIGVQRAAGSSALEGFQVLPYLSLAITIRYQRTPFEKRGNKRCTMKDS